MNTGLCMTGPRDGHVVEHDDYFMNAAPLMKTRNPLDAVDANETVDLFQYRFLQWHVNHNETQGFWVPFDWDFPKIMQALCVGYSRSVRLQQEKERT